jgi:hypothetical protein
LLSSPGDEQQLLTEAVDNFVDEGGATPENPGISLNWSQNGHPQLFDIHQITATLCFSWLAILPPWRLWKTVAVATIPSA